MPAEPPAALPLADPEATERLGARLARALAPGDTLLLDGPLGAGKTALARAVIRSLQGAAAEEVPSPSFTLVQTYATPRGEVWHVDLYRIAEPSGLAELGLEEAFEQAICLVEWPGRLGRHRPARCLVIGLAEADAGRRAEFRPQGAGWDALLREALDDA
jgi:tRNA threonylcarbamoyladenosine biosynthesis protein TsaE